MKTRNITLTLEKAREFYNSGNDTLREVALQAFTEDEINTEFFENFKSWKDVEDFLLYVQGINVPFITNGMSRGQKALIKLNHIRRILNADKKMNLTEGTIYYPYISFVTESSTCYNVEINSGEIFKVAKFRANNEKYTLLGGCAFSSSVGLGCLSYSNGMGDSYTTAGFLGCASKDIAKHMGKYFAKEIFDAMYGDFIDYEWI